MANVRLSSQPQQTERKHTPVSWRENLLFLIRSYGSARETIEHRGKFSAEWMQEINELLDALQEKYEAADNLVRIYEQRREPR